MVKPEYYSRLEVVDELFALWGQCQFEVVVAQYSPVGKVDRHAAIVASRHDDTILHQVSNKNV